MYPLQAIAKSDSATLAWLFPGWTINHVYFVHMESRNWSLEEQLLLWNVMFLEFQKTVLFSTLADVEGVKKVSTKQP